MGVFIYKWMLLSLLSFTNLLGSNKPLKASSVLHPFYVSVTEINHNASTKSLEISCKFFAEDLEQILEKDYKTQLDISAAKDKAAFDKDIPDYVTKRLALMVDGKPVALHYIGFEKDKESAYAYFEVSGIASVKNISATNSLLHDFIDQQINIMHVTVGGKRQSTKLDYPETKAAFNF